MTFVGKSGTTESIGTLLNGIAIRGDDITDAEDGSVIYDMDYKEVATESLPLEGKIHIEPSGTDPSTVLENDGEVVLLHEE